MFRRRSPSCCTSTDEIIEETVLVGVYNPNPVSLAVSSDSSVTVIIIVLSIVMLCATWSTCRHIRRQRVSNSCESSQGSDVLRGSPCIVTVSTIKETEFSQSHCVVCGAYHSLAEMPGSNKETSDVEKGPMANICG
jgi:hypothetical protein